MQNKEDKLKKEFTSQLEYDSKKGKLYWKISRGLAKKGDEVGYVRKEGYRCIVFRCKPYRVHRIIWLLEKGYIPKKQLDHINHDKDDNRIENLREVTHQENGKNQKLSIRNRSGFNGVSFDTTNKRWVASIGHNNKVLFLGRFDTIKEAVDVVSIKKKELCFHKNHGLKINK